MDSVGVGSSLYQLGVYVWSLWGDFFGLLLRRRDGG